MSRPRSPETEIRRLRQALRNAREAVRHFSTLGGSLTDWDRHLARDVKHQIDAVLAPKRVRRRRG
jgi:hypothetical protein